MYRNNLYTYCFAGGLVLAGSSGYILNHQRNVDFDKLSTRHNEMVFLHYASYIVLIAGLLVSIWGANQWYKKVYKINQLYR